MAKSSSISYFDFLLLSLFCTIMQPSFSSICILQKYFPDLLPLSSETSATGAHASFTDVSMSAFSDAILESTHRRHVRFTNAVQVASPGRHLHGEAKRKENEKFGEQRLQKPPKAKSPDSKAGSSKGVNDWNDMPKFLLAAAVSTIVSRTCVAPLERIKLECIVRGSKQPWLKTIQLIWAAEGLTGFWKGNLLNLFRMIPFKSINFICYDMYCDQLLRLPEKKEITNPDRLIAGGISGITATILCLPLDTIRTRLVAPGGEALGGVLGCLSQMVHNEGILSLYKGLTPALMSMGPASAVFYAVYDILKASYLSHKRKKYRKKGMEVELGVVRTLVYGAIAGACAETVTYPLEVVRRQLQLQQRTRLGLVAVFMKTIERDGLGSLFAGLAPSTLQVLPSAALSYLFYEMMKSILKIG